MNYIQMNAEMTKAIFDGRKVQTRRCIKHTISEFSYGFDINLIENHILKATIGETPKYKKGETVVIYKT